MELHRGHTGVRRLHLKPLLVLYSAQTPTNGDAEEKLDSGLSNALKPRARAARGFVLLVLLTHAFLASAMHFHGVARLGREGASLSRREEGRKAPLANGEEQCLVCRLQRNFASGLMRHAAPEVAPPASKQTGFASHDRVPAHAAHTLSAKGRAPPLS